jgi:farnesyl-diphosphate farnesyltransferase
VRVRLACAWPILIGLDTLQLLRERNALDAAQRIKISRARVRNLILKSVLLYPVPGAWRGWIKG